MDRTSVDSSIIASIGYENQVLEIEFLERGSVRQYFEVPEHLYFELISSESVGRYFLYHIQGCYPEAKISIKTTIKSLITKLIN